MNAEEVLTELIRDLCAEAGDRLRQPQKDAFCFYDSGCEAEGKR